MVSVLSVYSDDRRSNPAEVHNFYSMKIENKPKEAGKVPFLTQN